MDEANKGFRSAVFGGFRREDVLHYIEETDAKYHEETERLQRQLTETQSATAELRDQNETLTAKNAELLERLGEMTLDADRVREKLDQIEQGFTLQSAEIEAQSARAEALAAENDHLAEENKKLQEKCGEYDMTKEKIAEMELSAYRRAKQMEQDAKLELQKLRRQSMEMIEQVKRQLDATKENYRTVLARSQQESAEMARRAANVLTEIDRIAGSLGKEREKEPGGVLGKIASLRQKTEE